MNKVVYEDDDWVIELINDGCHKNIRVTRFKDFHYVNDFILKEEFFDDIYKNRMLNITKNILY